MRTQRENVSEYLEVLAHSSDMASRTTTIKFNNTDAEVIHIDGAICIDYEKGEKVTNMMIANAMNDLLDMMKVPDEIFITASAIIQIPNPDKYAGTAYAARVEDIMISAIVYTEYSCIIVSAT